MPGIYFIAFYVTLSLQDFDVASTAKQKSHGSRINDSNFSTLQLATRNDGRVSELIGSFDWYIYPIVNPDGYEYARTEVSTFMREDVLKYESYMCHIECFLHVNFVKFPQIARLAI